MNFSFHQSPGIPLQSIVNTASEDALRLMADFLAWSPEKRPTAANSLRFKYFQVGQKLGAPILSQPATSAVRKSSAGSTQSDSKLVIAKRALGVQQAGKLTQKVGGRKIENMANLLFFSRCPR